MIDSSKIGIMRIILLLATPTLMLDANESKMSILSKLLNSQGLAEKAYGIEVSAPTGHKSIILADSSSKTNFSI